MYPYDQYASSLDGSQRARDPWLQAYSIGGAGIGLAVSATEALDLVKNGRAVPLTAWRVPGGTVIESQR